MKELKIKQKEQLESLSKPQTDSLKTFYNQHFSNQMSRTKGLPVKSVAVYQSVFLARLVMFEPLYVSLQMLPDFQIGLIFTIQLAMTCYTGWAVFKK